MTATSEVGVDALELFVEVLSQSEDASGDVFYDRLCEAVCRLAHMRRALIFRYDSARRRVRAAGAHGLNLEQFADAHVTVESAPIAAQSLHDDRLIEVTGDMTGQFPTEYADVFPEPVRLVCAPMAAAGRNLGVIFADRLLTERPLDDAERHLLWTLGKAAALASVSRMVATEGERARQLEQRIDLAREILEGVFQRRFGISMALDAGDEGDVPPALEPLAQSILAEAVRNAHKHADPQRVRVRVGRRDGALVLEVANDGVIGSPARAGMGLRLAALEALQYGGVVEFGEREPGTWQVRLVVPVDH